MTASWMTDGASAEMALKVQERPWGVWLGSVGLMGTWDAQEPGVIRLPSGRLVRGRGLRHPTPAGLAPEFGLYLLNKKPEPMLWDARWVRWPDFGLPTDKPDALSALREAWLRSTSERVEIACTGGHGRTGTALAALAVLDGVPARDAVEYVRAFLGPRAVETPWQQRYIRRLIGR